MIRGTGFWVIKDELPVAEIGPAGERMILAIRGVLVIRRSFDFDDGRGGRENFGGCFDDARSCGASGAEEEQIGRRGPGELRFRR